MVAELNQYQQEAIKTFKKMSVEESNKYCAIKLCEEAGESASIIAKHYYHDKPFDVAHLKEELGDVMWYVANMAHVNGISLAEIADFNIDKLRERHGQQYKQEFYAQ